VHWDEAGDYWWVQGSLEESERKFALGKGQASVNRQPRDHNGQAMLRRSAHRL